MLKGFKEKIGRYARNSVCALSILAATAFPTNSANAKDITINGTISEYSSNLENKVIHLTLDTGTQQHILTDTTDANGYYEVQDRITGVDREETVQSTTYTIEQDNLKIKTPYSGSVKIQKYDIKGELVDILYDGETNFGDTYIPLRVQNDASGVYIFTIETQEGARAYKYVTIDGKISGISKDLAINAPQIRGQLGKEASTLTLKNITIEKDLNHPEIKIDPNMQIEDSAKINIALEDYIRNMHINIANCETGAVQGPAYAIIEGDSIYTATGKIDTKVLKKDKYEVKAGLLRADNLMKWSFARTQTIEDRETIEDTLHVVDYYLRDIYGNVTDSMYIKGFSPITDTSKITPELFEKLAYQANFREGSGADYEGLKKAQVDTIWIASHDTQNQYFVTRQDQEYIKSLIEREIFPTLKNKPEIYMEDPQNPETPQVLPGRVFIIPRLGGYYIGSSDVNKDGILENSAITFGYTHWQDANRDHDKIEELASAFFGPNQVDGFGEGIFVSKTVLSSGDPTYHLTGADVKLNKIVENYAPKESMDNILGL